MAAYNYALTTNTRVKNRLGLSNADATRDTVIDRMIYACTDFIEQACGGRRFKRQTISQEVYDGSPAGGTKVVALIVKNAPIVSGQTITIEYQAGTFQNPSWVDFSTSINSVDYAAGIIYVTLPVGIQNVRVSYTGGYLIDFSNEFTDTSHTLPYDLSDLCDRLVTKLFKKRESEGKSQDSFNNSSITWGDFLEAHDKTIIANFTRRQFV